MAPVEMVCTGGTLKPFWPIPPGEITGASAGGGATWSLTVAVNTAVKVPAVAVTVSVPDFVGVAVTPHCPLASVTAVLAESVAAPAVTAKVTLTPAGGTLVWPVTFTADGVRAGPQ